jgi:N-acetylglutamate synthase-like GNAT family acetyltransferase
VPELKAFLARAGLTLSGLDAPSVRLWLLQNDTGQVVGSAGIELSEDGEHSLIRSVAVDKSLRGAGIGLRLGQFALDQAAARGARQAWLFSRRSGAFWQKLGFAPADRADLVTALPRSHQVALFQETGLLDSEVAWSRPL